MIGKINHSACFCIYLTVISPLINGNKPRIFRNEGVQFGAQFFNDRTV